MSTQPTFSATTSGKPAARRPRRRIRTVLTVLGVMVAAMLALPFVANAAMTTFAAHDHGILDIVINGELVDLDQPRFHDLHPEFHIHPGHGNRWHHHPRHLGAMFSFERLTLRQALQAVGIEATDDELVFDGVSYDLTGTNVAASIHVGVVEVDPDRHLIGDGDRITVRVDTGS